MQAQQASACSHIAACNSPGLSQGSGLYHGETWLPHNQLLIPPHTRMSAPAVCEGLERGG